MTAQPHSELKVTVDVHKYTNHDPETRDDAQDPYRFEVSRSADSFRVPPSKAHSCAIIRR